MVDEVSGLRVWRVALQRHALTELYDHVGTEGKAAAGVVEDVTMRQSVGKDVRDTQPTPRVEAYFAAAAAPSSSSSKARRTGHVGEDGHDGDWCALESDSSEEEEEEDDFATAASRREARQRRAEASAAQKVMYTTRVAETGKWLNGVLNEPAYAVPSMSSVFSLYLEQRGAASVLMQGH